MTMFLVLWLKGVKLYSASTTKMNERGLTLIELMIVLAVIAILVSVGINVIDPTGSQGRARDGVRLTNVKNIAEVIESYRHVEGEYPQNTDISNESSLLRTTYLQNWPDPLDDEGKKDPDNWSYVYGLVDDGFVLYSPNSKLGCFKYQSDLVKTLDCPTSECEVSFSSLGDCGGD